MIEEELVKFGKRSYALKLYAALRWGKESPCPTRFAVNPYSGCSYEHEYCYSWYKCKKPIAKPGFRMALVRETKKAKELGFDRFWVVVSSSTDPFQPIEKELKEAHFAIGHLLANGFKVLIMTRNPGNLLEEDYIGMTKNPNLFIDVSIPSMHENDQGSIFYGYVPSLSDTIGAIKRLINFGKDVRIKIEPVIPTTDQIRGQTDEENYCLIKLLKQTGVKTVIAKTLRLNNSIPPELYEGLFSYYTTNGTTQGINLVLSPEIRKKLLHPIFQACQENAIQFCSCVETDIFPKDQTVKCLCAGETALPIAPFEVFN